MAERPVFAPVERGTRLVQEIPVQFKWHSGLAPSQKKKNVAALHEAAARRGLAPLLEISSKSNDELGQDLSAFNLKVNLHGQQTTLECAYQGSKIFEQGGPFHDLYSAESRDARRDERLRQSGRLIGFRFEDADYPLSPTTVFYDWLYINALFRQRTRMESLQQYAGFTDIEFNPERSLNCQARSAAMFVALEKRRILDDAIDSFGAFKQLHQGGDV
jgi:hypothetical protein